MDAGGNKIADVLVPQGMEVEDPIRRVAERQDGRFLALPFFLGGRRLGNPSRASGSEIGLDHGGGVVHPSAQPQALLRGLPAGHFARTVANVSRQTAAMSRRRRLGVSRLDEKKGWIAGQGRTTPASARLARSIGSPLLAASRYSIPPVFSGQLLVRASPWRAASMNSAEFVWVQRARGAAYIDLCVHHGHVGQRIAINQKDRDQAKGGTI